MYKKTALCVLIIISLLTGCASDQILTEKERAIQNRADSVVADTLFERDMEGTASYNIRKNGRVVILFDTSVRFQQYNDLVQFLRKHPAINGVDAEQDGVQVCPIRL